MSVRINSDGAKGQNRLREFLDELPSDTREAVLDDFVVTSRFPHQAKQQAKMIFSQNKPAKQENEKK